MFVLPSWHRTGLTLPSIAGIAGSNDIARKQDGVRQTVEGDFVLTPNNNILPFDAQINLLMQ